MNTKGKTMDDKTSKALEGSIAKWEGIVAGTVENNGPENCPLCQKFANLRIPEVDRCSGCPVRDRTGQKGCSGSPYPGYHAWQNNTKQVAQEEVDFLKSLRDEKISSLTKRNGHTFMEVVAAWIDHPERLRRKKGIRPSTTPPYYSNWLKDEYTIVEVHNDLTWEQVEAGYPRAKGDAQNGFQFKSFGGWENAHFSDLGSSMKRCWKLGEIRIDPDYDPNAKVEPVLYWGMTAEECYSDYKDSPSRWEFRSLFGSSLWLLCLGYDDRCAFIQNLNDGDRRRKETETVTDQPLARGAIKKGMFVTVLRWTQRNDRSMVGDVLEVLSVDLPFVVVHRHTGYVCNIHQKSLNLNEIELKELSDEFVAAALKGKS